MSDIFISHAAKDDAFVDRIHDTLEAQVKNCQVWVDHRDLLAGVNFDDRINDQLRASDYLLLVISQNSLKSGEVGGEWRSALLNNIPILLALIDDTPFKDLPYRLTTINAVNLKQDWDGGIAQLVRALNGETSTATDTPLFKPALVMTGTIDRRLTQTPLRGRDKDVTALKAAIPTAPTVIVGVGGLGKSKLAAEVALTGDAWQA